jgi:DNA-binding SARP family transcriptional activator
MPTFHILGPVEVVRDGRRQPLGSGKVAALAVALAVRCGTHVGQTRLFECLWTEPPVSALANLRTYVHRLRRVAGFDTLHEREGGYVLSTRPEDCDHVRFRHLCELGRSAVRDCDLVAAAARLEQALRLWRDDRAAESVPRHGPLAGWLAALDDERTAAATDLAEVWLRLGQPATAVDQLRRLLAVAPTESRAWRLRMIGHHRLREPGAVTRAYREAVASFRTHLDMDVDPQLTVLHGRLCPTPAPRVRADSVHPDPELLRMS